MLAFLASLLMHAALLFGVALELSTPPAPTPLQVEMKPMPKRQVTEAALDGLTAPKRRAAQKPQVTSKLFRKPAKPRAGHGKNGSAPVAATEQAVVETAPGMGGVGVTPSEFAHALSSASPHGAEARVAPTEPREDAAMDGRAEADGLMSAPSHASSGDGEGAVSAAPGAAQDAARIHALPERGRILYHVDRGDREFEIGRAVSEWEVVEGRYVLRLRMETTGLVWLFKSYRIDMESRGRLTARGLQPERFAIRRNGETGKERAEFDWTQMRVSVADGSPQPLDPGAQDLLSFNFHLGFMPDPKVATHLSIATGKKYAIYPLEAVGDEEVELPMGTVQTLHVRSSGEHTTELWLAYDYFLLPVKIRHVDRKGDSFVQTATGIHVDAEAP